MTPAKDLQEYVDSFFIFPCCDLSDSLAYNDGTPMLAFLSEAEDEVELEYNEEAPDSNPVGSVQGLLKR